MRRVDLNALEAEYDDTDPDGYRAGMARFGEHLEAVMIGGTVYELPPGQSNWPAADRRDHVMVRRKSAVDYWDGEA